ncbi:MAG: hypothetical protein OXP69_23560 [Spirochaetaceae bacterium]|nr:hypothetical protein [Spirochaetaceae bacterium]
MTRSRQISIVMAGLAIALAPFVAGAQQNVLVELPMGAIVAFDREMCPEGWLEYTPAEGRVLIGQGKVHDNEELIIKRGVTGGESMHDHGRTGGGHGSTTRDRGGDNPPMSFSSHTHDVNNSNTLPPFIGVLFCRLDG